MSHHLNTNTGGLPGLPAPKLTLIGVGGIPGVMADGGTAQMNHVMRVNLHGIPDLYITDPTYDLGLELVRRKTRARRHNTKNARAGVVHPVNYAGGAPSPILLGNLAGSAPNFSASDRPTEWSLVGLPHNATVKIEPEAFSGFFRKTSVTDGVAGHTLIGYLDGRSAANVFSTYLGLLGLSPYNPTGVFWFRYSVFDPAIKRRVTGPLSVAAVVQQERAVSTPRWRTGASPVSASHEFNPLFAAFGPGPLTIRLNHRGVNSK